MKFRKSLKRDIKDIMKIIKQAQVYFKENGIDQWQNNYPNEEVILRDIQNECSYVLLKDNNIIGTTVISFKKDTNYDKIFEGHWLSNGDYAVIHRIAIDNNYKGLGISHKIIEYAKELTLERGFKSIKVDTHEDNISMKSLLKSNEFKYCGIIYLEDGSKRVAFEKRL